MTADMLATLQVKYRDEAKAKAKAAKPTTTTTTKK